MTRGVFFVGVSLGRWEQTAQKAGNGLVGEGRAAAGLGNGEGGGTGVF